MRNELEKLIDAASLYYDNAFADGRKDKLLDAIKAAELALQQPYVRGQFDALLKHANSHYKMLVGVEFEQNNGRQVDEKYVDATTAKDRWKRLIDLLEEIKASNFL